MPLRAIKHQLTCSIEFTSGSSMINRNGILVISRNHLVLVWWVLVDLGDVGFPFFLFLSRHLFVSWLGGDVGWCLPHFFLFPLVIIFELDFLNYFAINCCKIGFKILQALSSHCLKCVSC